MPSLDVFNSKTLSEMVKCGVFGRDAEVLAVTKENSQAGDHFMSVVKFVTVDVSISGTLKQFRLFIKFQIPQTELAISDKLDFHFFNENFMYKEILPMLEDKAKQIFLKYYYGKATNGVSRADDVVVLENAILSGFVQTKERIFIDYDHCLLVFKKLGVLHGASLLLKEKSPKEFNYKISQLRETRWHETDKDSLNYKFRVFTRRGVLSLIGKGQNSYLTNILNRLEDVFSIMKEILKPGSMSVLCHGDCCRNNMLFKYTNGKPVDLKFYDLATSKFSTPIVDISFFIFLNIAPDLRRKHFKDLLNTYLESMKSVAGTCAPTMEQLWAEFQRKAVYGYIIVALFLPVMVDPESRVWKNYGEERLEHHSKSGGREVTNILTDIVRDLLDWGCL